MKYSDKENVTVTPEEQTAHDFAPKATVRQQFVLTLKLIGIVGLLGGLLWVLDNISAQ